MLIITSCYVSVETTIWLVEYQKYTVFRSESYYRLGPQPVILIISKLFRGQGFSIRNVASNYKDPEPSVSLTETSHMVYFI